MTKVEFEQKLAAYKSSSAPVEVKEKAIKTLEESFYGINRRNEMLLADIESGKADISDMGGY